MQAIMILVAGALIGVWHERDKAKAARKAFRDGQAYNRQQQRDHRVYADTPREAIPVPGYQTGQVVPTYYIRKELVNGNSTQAVTLGRAAGRVQ